MADIRVWEDTPKPGETYGGWLYSLASNGHIYAIEGGFPTEFDARCAAGSFIKADGTIDGQEAYECHCRAMPHYHDGTPRKPWDKLDPAIQRNWCRGDIGGVIGRQTIVPQEG